jgi:hypothetical protein
LEFRGALEAESDLSADMALSIDFTNALDYSGETAMADVSIEHFNEAMQYISFDPSPGMEIQRDAVIRAIERCSLVHALYEVVAVADDIDELESLAILDGGFEDLYKGGPNGNATWCFRGRNYGDLAASDIGKDKRFGARTRSMRFEREGLVALDDLFARFGGKVKLEKPDCKIYLFDGLVGTKKVLARRIAVGPKVRAC